MKPRRLGWLAVLGAAVARTADVQAANLGREVERYIHTHFFAAAH